MPVASLARRGLLIAGAGFLLIQAVPYGRSHAAPPSGIEPAWDSPQTRALAARACFDCHSNQTTWPWYSQVAPVSWLLQRDVDEGRRKLNFTEWERPQRDARESAERVQEGEMPPWYYVPLYPAARLTGAETQSLVQGLRTTLGSGGGSSDGRRESRR